MPIMPLIELVSGLVALVLTAMAFTYLSWGEGASSPELKRESAAKSTRLF